MKLIAKWLLSAAALLAVAYLYNGVQVTNFTSALIAAFVLGLFNTILRPLLILLALPVTVVTLGLFLFVINALLPGVGLGQIFRGCWPFVVIMIGVLGLLIAFPQLSLWLPSLMK